MLVRQKRYGLDDRAAASRSGARSSPAAHDPRRCFTDDPCPPPWRPRGLASSWPPQSARPQVAQQPQRAHAIQTRRGKKKRREKITTRRKRTPPIAATACGRAWWWCGVRLRVALHGGLWRLREAAARALG